MHDTMQAVKEQGDLVKILHHLIGSVNIPDGRIEIGTATAILKGICTLHMLPELDEKRIVIIYSRYSTDGTLRGHGITSFLDAALRRILRMVEQPAAEFPLARSFFVMKSSGVSKAYRFKTVIGQGSFGIVHRVVEISSGQERVCKSIAKGSASIPIHQLEAEIRIIAQLDHPNIIRMYEYFEDDSHVHLVMECCKNGDLLSRIKQSIKSGMPLSHEFVVNCLRQTLIAIAFMKNNRIVHKDLKPENVMLTDVPGRPNAPLVKVIDFGLSEVFSPTQETSNTVAGTAFYMAPEIFRPPFNSKCDVWSCGVITYFMLTGFLPFFGSTVGEVKSNVLYRRLQWPPYFGGGDKPLAIPTDLKNFVEVLLEKDHRIRPHASEALRHEFFTHTHSIHTLSQNVSMGIALNIRSYSRLTTLRKCILQLIAHVWQFEESDAIRDIFTQLDSSQSGYITVAKLARTLALIGLPIADAWVAAKSVDLTGTSSITYTPLTAAIILPLLDSNKRIIATAYNALAPSRKDVVTIESMWAVLCGIRSAQPTTSPVLSLDDFSKLVENEIAVTRRSRSDTSRSGIKSGMSSSMSNAGGLYIEYSRFRDWLMS